MSRFWLNKGYDAKMTVSGSTVAQQESVVLAETFERHWDQLKGITNNVRKSNFSFDRFRHYFIPFSDN